MSENPSPVRIGILGVVSIGLIVGGGYAITAGVSQLNMCGSTELNAAEAPERPDRYTEFSNLSAQQQELAERAIRGEDPAVSTVEEWPWLESSLRVQYQGDYYELYTVTTPCAIPPGVFVIIGIVTGLFGLLLFAIAGRQYRNSRNTTTEPFLRERLSHRCVTVQHGDTGVPSMRRVVSLATR